MELTTGLRMTNIVSYGAGKKLMLTYSYANGRKFNIAHLVWIQSLDPPVIE
jgi:hypothetical protein